MITAVAVRPSHAMTFDRSPMPPTEQERIRLLCAIKKATDHYELAFASAELDGFSRGLFVSGAISESTLTVFNAQHLHVYGIAFDRIDQRFQCEL
ncbi:hypothetical protein NA647_19250 [Pseudomonas stutzeri]|uniref:hypothetical protein n=1 Tax=Stutzerimonas stutzeri TaxID=316 RepID=UPI00210EF307|nr:hypothetical protein [Stutzerimonas stutzeri]MCQ4289548.1 hypothetical protein [Stutzerimonas stutzeri]